jgi:hypothetical protein
MNRQAIATLLVLLAALMLPAAQLGAQARTNVQGKIDSVMLDDQSIIIDGQSLAIYESQLVVMWKGRVLRPSMLSPGMSIFFSTADDGSVRAITLIGPAEILERIDAH